ncbi:MAG: hypothetical protein DME17_21155 [Candidatus Rokuibacteriota bacterium]|nr:MAG: hypothetical protein DME17_21155 [Candidatus Rokubacteria bacterium]
MGHRAGETRQNDLERPVPGHGRPEARRAGRGGPAEGDREGEGQPRSEGAERELVLVNGTLIAALIFGVGFHWASLGMAVLLATVGHWGLARAARHDPQLSRIYVRHVRYQEHYLARAAAAAPPGYVFPSVAD